MPLLHDRDRGLGGLAPRDVGRDRVSGVVVDELEDHALPAAGQDVLGRVQLPQAFGAGYTNRRYAARGFFLGSARATPASRKIRASDAVDGTGVQAREPASSRAR